MGLGLGFDCCCDQLDPDNDCCIGEPADEFQVQIAGIENSFACDECINLNGTFVLERQADPTAAPYDDWFPNAVCVWAVDVEMFPICTGGTPVQQIALAISRGVGATYSLTVRLDGVGQYVIYYGDLESKPDCGLSDVEIGYLNSLNLVCDHLEISTCTIDAL